jgi:tRNA A-37 threonylcarbamoyl transferase component Bud32
MADPIPTRTKEEDAAAARVGSTLRGKWRLDALLGVGGVAAVYAATHRNGQRAALKVMHVELARDRGIVDRFLREAYVANKVGHPACVRVLDDDVSEGDEPFLVMELLEGETVRDYWRRTGRTIPVSQALHIAERVLDCLGACHAVGVVHRDLKPANIFLLRSGAIKLLDFGVAREEGARQESDKTVGLALGTPAYMSPEQAKGQVDRIDGRSDVFSVGALLHALITGRRIHRGKTEKESLHLAANEPVPSVATVDASMPSELVRLIDRALAWDPERRFGSAREMQSAVIAAMRGASDASRAAPDADADDDAPDLTPVHEVVARDDARVREVEAFLGACEAAFGDGLIHGFESRSAEPALRRAFDACVEVHRRRNAAITLRVRPFGFAAFDHVLWEPARPLAAIPYRLFQGGVRVLRFMQGLSFAELRTVLACVSMPGDVDVCGALWEATLPHVRVDACLVTGLGDIAAREAFGAEALRDETQAAHRVHAARETGAAWSDETSPLAPDEVIRAVYASQLGVDRWDERYAELYTDGLLQGARTRTVGTVLGALRKVAVDLYASRRWADARSLRAALAERLARRVGPRDAPKLAAAVTSAMLGKEALDTLLRTLAHHPEDAAQVGPLLDDVPPPEVTTVLAAASRPMPAEAQPLVSGLVARLAGPAEAEAFAERSSSVPTLREELAADAILPLDERSERHAAIVFALATLLEGASGHDDAAASLATDLSHEVAGKPFEVFFAEAATFVSGRMLYAERAVHEAAQTVSSLLARCGAHAFVCSAAPSVEQVRAFAAATRDALDRAAPLPSVGPLSLVAMSQAARTRGVAIERLAVEPRVMRVHASAVGVLRGVGEAGSDVPRAVVHVARSIVDVAASPPWLLGAVTEPDLDADAASLAVSAAMLATAMARLLIDDRSQLLRIALAALTIPVAKGEDALARIAATLGSQTNGQRTAVARAVVAFEAAWLARADIDGALYRGARAPTLHARILACARDYVERMGDKTPPPPSPPTVVASLAQRAADTAERTVLRLLVATLGFIPAGTVVRLSSGETAEVIASNRGTGRGPTARLVLDEGGEEYSEPFEVEIALSGDEGLRIDKVLGVEQWRKGETLASPKPPPVERRVPPPRPSEPLRAARDEAEAGDGVSGPRPASAHATPSPPVPVQNATATGKLATTPLVNTLVYMLDHGLTGTITLREPDGTSHALYFVRGAPARVRTGRLLAPLGGLLVAEGHISDGQAAEAVSQAKQIGMRLGDYLVSRGALASHDLAHALKQQLTRKIEALVNLDAETAFAFYRDIDLFPDGTEAAPVEPLGVVFAATRALKDRERVRKVVERASGLLIAIHPESTLEIVELDQEERTLLAELREQPSHFIELVTRSPVSPQTLDTFLFVALVTRQLLVPGQAKSPMGADPVAARVSRVPPITSAGASTAPAAQAPASPPPASRGPQKKVSWSDLLAVRRPPSQVAMHAVRTPQPKSPPPKPVTPQPKVESPLPPALGAPPSSPAPKSVRIQARSMAPHSTRPSSQPARRGTAPPAKARELSASGAEAVALMRRAEQALSHKDIVGALRLIERARQADGTVPQVNAFFAWVRVLAGKARPAQAISELDDVIERDPWYVPARVLRAKLLKRDDRVHEAMRELEVVLTEEPDNKEAQSELRLLMLTVKPHR